MVKVPLLGTMENEIVMQDDKLAGKAPRSGPTHPLVMEFPSASSGGLNTRRQNACSFHPIRLL